MNIPSFDALMTVHALGAVVPSSSTPQYISMKHVVWLRAQIFVLNGTTVTGSAITLKQATAVAGTGEKALAFTAAKRNIDCGAGNVLAEFAVTSNTFTTDSTNSKRLLYEIDVNPAHLDVANAFDCFRVGTGNATAATVSVAYLLFLKYGGAVAGQPSVIVD